MAGQKSEKENCLDLKDNADSKQCILVHVRDKKNSRRVPIKLIIASSTAIITCFLFIFTANVNYLVYLNGVKPASTNNNIKRPRYGDQNINDKKFTIRTEGCTIPAMSPFSDDVNKFVSKPDIAPCRNADHRLLTTNKTHIWINKSYIEYYNIKNLTETSCCYKSFYRSNEVKDIYDKHIDNRATYRECVNFSDIIEVKDEFVRVTCNFKGNKVYDQMYIYAPEKKKVLHSDSLKVPKNKYAYNIIILGIDAVSRLNFHRTMVKTLAFFNKKGAVEMLGYNKVGDNSYVNLVPLLMGYNIAELKKICHPNAYANYDFCPIIWNIYKEAGYYTAFGEDSSYAGAFNYLLDGFIRSPTDYYAHTFIHQAQTNIGYEDLAIKMCLGDRYAYQILLDYAKDVFVTLQSHKLFAYFWESTITHEYLNGPMLMDSDYEKFFRDLDRLKYLDESIIFLISDHGARVGAIKRTKQGGYEERLPLVYILLPPLFRSNYSTAYSNLIENTKRLTTPFDIHETLADLVDLNSISDEEIKSKMNKHYADDRGISLFLPIPTNRTCTMAAIDDHYCTCYRKENISRDSEEALNAAKYLTQHLNWLLKGYKRCAVLSLKEILEAAVMVTSMGKDGKSTLREYVVVVQASPGDGLFEGTMHYKSKKWTISGAVSRLNLYGKQGLCVDDPGLRKYCFCV